MKLDCLSNFLTSNTISPSCKSKTVCEELGSSLILESVFPLVSNFVWVNFLMLRLVSDFMVETVPLDSNKMTFDAGPV